MPKFFVAFLPRLGLVLLLLLATGCSFTRLGYQNLDWFINWKLRDYVSLNREQKRWLTSELKGQLAWHCNSELPRYRPHLLALRDQALAPSIQAQDLAAFIPIWEREAGRTLERLLPTAAGLARQLDDRQVREVERNLAEQNRKMRERYLAPEPARQARERTERVRERLESWLGRLTPAQQQRVEAWSQGMGGRSEAWLDNRERWQQRLLRVLAERHKEGFDAALAELFLDPASSWTESYRIQRERSTTEMTVLVAEVFSSAEPRQREHLQKRAAGLLQDMDAIRCAAQT